MDKIETQTKHWKRFHLLLLEQISIFRSYIRPKLTYQLTFCQANTKTNGEAREIVFVESVDPYHKPKTTNWQGLLSSPPCLLWITTSTGRNKNKKSNSLAYYERPL